MTTYLLLGFYRRKPTTHNSMLNDYTQLYTSYVVIFLNHCLYVLHGNCIM